jgi:hypothetical protein
MQAEEFQGFSERQNCQSRTLLLLMADQNYQMHVEFD